MTARLLAVEDLSVSFPSPDGPLPALRGVSLALDPGATLGVVGESGCGKSLTALSVTGLLPAKARVTGGRIRLGGEDVLGAEPAALRRIRGREVGMVFQEPMTSLNPVFRVGSQLAEAVRAQGRVPREEVRARCVALLREVGVSAPEERLRAYPAELSGGMRQRVMIAMAVACRPRLLIADEPTTALDVTIQAQIMALMARLRRELGMALLLITHDLGVIAHEVERVAVMYAGQVVEEAATGDLFAEPLHPYTRGLLASVPGTRAAGGGRRLHVVPGSVPPLARLPSGCAFRDRCPRAVSACAEEPPALEEKRPARRARCLRVERRV